MTTIISHAQKSDLGEYVKLYHLDLSKFGLDDFYFVEGPEGGGAAQQATFDEIVYSPFDIRTEGFDVRSRGALPRPRFAVSNVSGIFTSIVVNNKNLKGAVLTRTRTFGTFLDDGATPDTGAIFGTDVYILDRKVRDDEELIEWELASPMDREDSVIPGRMLIRDFCDHTTRFWTGSAFSYTGATCPWTGDPYDADGEEVASGADEVFSKKLDSCCRARFGNAELPFRGFPGAARVRNR